jgi:hypothetical protein
VHWSSLCARSMHPTHNLSTCSLVKVWGLYQQTSSWSAEWSSSEINQQPTHLHAGVSRGSSAVTPSTCGSPVFLRFFRQLSQILGRVFGSVLESFGWLAKNSFQHSMELSRCRILNFISFKILCADAWPTSKLKYFEAAIISRLF